MGLGYGKYKASSVGNVHDIDTRSSYRSAIFWAAFFVTEQNYPRNSPLYFLIEIRNMH